MSKSTDPVVELLASVRGLDCLQQLASAAPFLRSAEKAVASFILEHPERASDMTANELAQASGASEATVFRLCRDLGYKGYTELRNGLRRVVDCFSPSFLRSMSVTDRPEQFSVIDSVAYLGIRTLLDASLAVSPANLQAAAQSVAAAGRVQVYGMGPVSGRLAELFTFGLQRLGIVANAWVDERAARAVPPTSFGPNDAVIGISHSGENRDVAHFLAAAVARRAPSIAVTNYASSPVGRAADLLLLTAARETEIQRTELLPRMGQMYVFQALLASVREVKKVANHPEEVEPFVGESPDAGV